MSVAARMADLSPSCPACAGERARQSVHDHAFDMKHDSAIPVSAQGEFEEHFGDAIVKMADWAEAVADHDARQGDFDLCERHAAGRIWE